jgi:hypothetical protein
VSKAGRRYYRTTVLGVLAMASLIWVAMDQFGISPGEMSELFLATLLVLGLVIAAAAVVVLFWMALRKLLRRNSER